tara:strand:- start:823 stop:1440 length:618 start_codon:yes stop_codon:yes gene_type:complete
MKILVIATNSIKANVKQRFGEYESMELCKKDYLETIDNVQNLKLSYEDFKVNYNNIGKRLKSLTYDFVYYENKNEIFFYNGIETKTSQFFEVNEEKDYAIATEFDSHQCHILTKEVYDNLLININKIFIAWNNHMSSLLEIKQDRLEWEHLIVENKNNHDTLKNQFYIDGEYLDYNTFDFSTGEILTSDISSINSADLNILTINY